MGNVAHIYRNDLLCLQKKYQNGFGNKPRYMCITHGRLVFTYSEALLMIILIDLILAVLQYISARNFVIATSISICNILQ